MSCGVAAKTVALDRQLYFILGGVKCSEAIRKHLLATGCPRELLQGETFVPFDSPAAYNWWLLKSALMSSYQLARYSSLHRAQARTMEELSIREMLFWDVESESSNWEKGQSLGRLWNLALSHWWWNQDLQPLKGLSTLAQLQPTQPNYQATLPRHSSLKTVMRDVACISLT